jgi:exopolysaccharide biosynthesis operon protein EpsL
VNTATAMQKYRKNAVTSCINKYSKTLKINVKSIRRLRCVCRSVAVGFVFVALSQPVFAVTKLDQTFTPYVGTSHTYDSNLLRASDKSTNPNTGKTVKDSFIHQIRAGLNVDWRRSRQQFIVNAEVNQNWFTAFDSLDYFGHNVLGQWNWVVGNRLKGELGYRHDESLASFAQLNANNQKNVLNNLQTEQRYFANGEYQLLPDIYLKAGFTRNEWDYGKGRENSNQIQNIGEFSVQYRNLSRTMFGFRAVITDGQYPDRDKKTTITSDNAFLRTSYNIDGEWKYSDKLRFGGSVGYVQQDYEHITALGFSDAVARFDLNWLPSEKTALIFSAWREVNQAYTQNATFVLSTGVSVKPTWLPTAKIRVEMPLAYETQDYLGDVQKKGGPQRSDDVVDIGLNLIYTPWINTELALNVKHESRSSNLDGKQPDGSTNYFAYDAQMVGISAKVEF